MLGLTLILVCSSIKSVLENAYHHDQHIEYIRVSAVQGGNNTVEAECLFLMLNWKPDKSCSDWKRRRARTVYG